MSPIYARRIARGLCTVIALAGPACSHDWSSSHDAEEEDTATADASGDDDAGAVGDAAQSSEKPDGSVGPADASTRDAQPILGDAAMDATTADVEVDAGVDAGADYDTGVDANTDADASIDAGPPCYADKDKDGVGAGQPVSCEGYGTDAGAGLSLLNTDCDDNNNQRSPSLTDVCGDKVDNDCDGTPDDESNNACGGPCTTQLAHQPNESCDNGLLGACKKTGKYVCGTGASVWCDAQVVAAIPERCGDAIDNDCDGNTDESDAVDAKTWYPDCDHDGYSALSEALIAAKVGYVVSCTQPAPQLSCGWTTLAPIGVTSRDCDDSSGGYKPGADFGLPPEGKTSTDLNCDGTSEKEPAMAIYDGFWQVPVPVKVCSAATNCTSCAAGGGRGQWLASDNVTPTDTQPACSTNINDTRMWRNIYWSDGESCYMGKYYSNPYGGWQRCR